MPTEAELGRFEGEGSAATSIVADTTSTTVAVAATTAAATARSLGSSVGDAEGVVGKVRLMPAWALLDSFRASIQS